ncbi:MAG: hypothetical protein H6616_00225 [Ignavibacteria bacterium]|nr:hypothetical protein [Ignavibacteria bacterium]
MVSSPEGEASRAETLLRRAFDLLSGDEEIGETLRQALIASGNRVEAARVKMAMTP